MKLSSRFFCLAALLLAAVALAKAPPIFAIMPADGPQVEVKIDNFSFAPGTITIAAGTTVRWTNHDDIPHNVVSTDKSFKSKVLDTDETFSYTFTTAGTYDYFCSIHPKMTGKVVVQ
ncbi:MAG TPA: cupredoxin family copper-binding protein [Candidatus Angelobacter sp.]